MTKPASASAAAPTLVRTDDKWFTFVIPLVQAAWQCIDGAQHAQHLSTLSRQRHTNEADSNQAREKVLLDNICRSIWSDLLHTRRGCSPPCSGMPQWRKSPSRTCGAHTLYHTQQLKIYTGKDIQQLNKGMRCSATMLFPRGCHDSGQTRPAWSTAAHPSRIGF